jgi:hypothetical protein
LSPIDASDARRLAGALLAESFPDAVGEYTILDELTERVELGWVFFYESRAYLITGDWSRRLAGNAPILVTDGGAVQFTGTHAPIEEILAAMKTTGTLP